jgi:peptidoglycan/LPS O-acetylase OafA/YrhL
VIRSACYVHTPMSPIQSSGAHPCSDLSTGAASGSATDAPVSGARTEFPQARAVAVRGDYLPALEGIRGLAVLLVVLSHMSSSDVFFDRSVNFRGLGNYGVHLFFVLSAFLLTRQFLERPPKPLTSVRYWTTYAVRRGMRIYPLYTVALLATTLSPFVSWALAGPKPLSIPRHLMLLDGHKILWTIPVEMKFYALLPGLLIAIFAVAGSRPVRTVLFLLVVLSISPLVLPPKEMPMLSIDLRDYLSIFLFGMMASAAWQGMQSRRIPEPLRLLCDVLAIFFLLAVLAPQALGSPFGPSHALIRGWLTSTVAWYGAAWSLFVLATLAGRYVPRLFELRALRAIGVASFSAYLWHMPIIESLRRELPPTPLTFFIILAAVLAASLVSYRVLERPGIALSARWARRRLEAART